MTVARAVGPQTLEVDIAELTEVWDWMRETARTDADLFWRLSRPNQHVFSKLWGRGGVQKGKDGVMWTWKFRHQGLHWVITTGATGTRYALMKPVEGASYHQDPRVSRGAMTFLQALGRQLTTLDE